MRERFVDRVDAGRRLAELLRPYAAEKPIVLALPRGGVPVALEVANALGAPMDVWVVRKIGAPDFPELGVGAVAEGGIVHLDPEVMSAVGLSRREADALAERKKAEVEERVRRFRGDRPAPDVEGRTVILVDDGIATGGTTRAAIAALRRKKPGKIVLAVPVAPPETLEAMRDLVEDVAVVVEPVAMQAIGAWYDDFTQVSDDEVAQVLEEFRRREEAAPAPGSSEQKTSSPREGNPAVQAERSGEVAESKPSRITPPATESATKNQGRPREVTIPTEAGDLHGKLTVPEGATGLAVFAHGSGSSRFSPRNQHVADVLQQYGLGTLLFDLLTEHEELLDVATAEYRFNIDLLAERLVEVTKWVRAHPDLSELSIGYFGSSTGAAAALVAAAKLPDEVAAVVSRGGRPDLAWSSLEYVRAPTLLIVGGNDRTVLELNQRATARLHSATHELAVIPRASHLFEERGALDMVARLAGHWFQRFFRPKHIPAPLEHP